MIGFAAAAALGVSVAAGAQPQPASGTPNALQGFSQNRNQPIKIDADSLEVRDKEKVATFSGKVQLVQGDTVLNCKKMVVFYDNDTKTAMAASDGGGQQSIRRIEVRGDVVVTQKDQKATADNGFFDMKANTITLVGNVVISQGPQVVRGDRLVVDLTTNVSRVECDRPNCRVGALLQPAGKDNPANAGAGREGLKPRPLSPSGL
jgi:lipopolysaccharide export system protein LptA